jgi:hypothetical protein
MVFIKKILYLLQLMDSTVNALCLWLIVCGLIELRDATRQVAPAMIPVFVGIQLVFDSGHPVSVFMHHVFDAFGGGGLWSFLGH